MLQATQTRSMNILYQPSSIIVIIHILILSSFLLTKTHPNKRILTMLQLLLLLNLLFLNLNQPMLLLCHSQLLLNIPLRNLSYSLRASNREYPRRHSRRLFCCVLRASERWLIKLLLLLLLLLLVLMLLLLVLLLMLLMLLLVLL